MFYDDYTHIDSLVERVRENNSDALWELFDFYKLQKFVRHQFRRLRRR